MENKPKIKSAYQELSHLLNDFKEGKINNKELLDKIQLKENSIRPYCKVTEEGKIALHEIIEEPLVLEINEWKRLTKVMKEEKWDKLTQTIKNGYIDKYIFFNEQRAFNKKYKPIDNLINIESSKESKENNY
jgi:hypothetical protein